MVRHLQLHELREALVADVALDALDAAVGLGAVHAWRGVHHVLALAVAVQSTRWGASDWSAARVAEGLALVFEVVVRVVVGLRLAVLARCVARGAPAGVAVLAVWGVGAIATDISISAGDLLAGVDAVAGSEVAIGAGAHIAAIGASHAALEAALAIVDLSTLLALLHVAVLAGVLAGKLAMAVAAGEVAGIIHVRLRATSMAFQGAAALAGIVLEAVLVACLVAADLQERRLASLRIAALVAGHARLPVALMHVLDAAHVAGLLSVHLLLHAGSHTTAMSMGAAGAACRKACEAGSLLVVVGEVAAWLLVGVCLVADAGSLLLVGVQLAARLGIRVDVVARASVVPAEAGSRARSKVRVEDGVSGLLYEDLIVRWELYQLWSDLLHRVFG